MHSLKKNPTSLVALTTEPKRRLSDAVCQRSYLYDTLYRIAVLFIEATHHVICQPDLPTTADNLERMSGAMGHNTLQFRESNHLLERHYMRI